MIFEFSLSLGSQIQRVAHSIESHCRRQHQRHQVATHPQVTRVHNEEPQLQQVPTKRIAGHLF